MQIRSVGPTYFYGKGFLKVGNSNLFLHTLILTEISVTATVEINCGFKRVPTSSCFVGDTRTFTDDGNT